MNNGSKSFFQKTVYLDDWWLLKADSQSSGERLGVGGFTLRNNVRQEFSSAPIVKVHDTFTLETLDGICIILEYLINKTRTIENGFPSKVFESFILGFPHNWEAFATKDAWETSPPNAAPDADLGSLHFNDIPEARRTRSTKRNDTVHAQTHESKCIKKSKTKSGSRSNKQDEEAENEISIQKNLNIDDCISPRPHSRHNKQSHTTEGGVAVVSGIASTPGSNTKRKLDYESPPFENGTKKASAGNGEPSMPDGLRSETIQATQGSNKKSNAKHNRMDVGGVEKAFKPKKVDKGAQTDPGKKKTFCREEVGSVSRFSTPEKCDKVESPQSLTPQRSRSGRLLLPPLAFWRNQRAVYDLERKVTGIVDEL